MRPPTTSKRYIASCTSIKAVAIGSGLCLWVWRVCRTCTSHVRLQVDHFNSSDSRTFSQRVLSNRHNFNQKDGPIFFYTGNEGDITWFCNNTVSMKLNCSVSEAAFSC